MSTKNIYTISIYDYILAASFGLIAIFLVYFFYFHNLSTAITAAKAEIFRNNELIYALDLQKNQRIKYNGMEIEINAGKIRVRESDCPRKVCVHSGWISGPNQRIICIPKKVLIQITGIATPDKNDQFDYEMK